MPCISGLAAQQLVLGDKGAFQWGKTSRLSSPPIPLLSPLQIGLHKQHILPLLQLECVLPIDQISTNTSSYYFSELPRLDS